MARTAVGEPDGEGSTARGGGQESLQLLRTLTPTKKHNQFDQAAEDDVHAAHKQGRPPTDGNTDASAASGSRVFHPIEYLYPTRAIGDYVNRYHHRPHSRLDYRTPHEVARTWEDQQGLQKLAA